MTKCAVRNYIQIVKFAVDLTILAPRREKEGCSFLRGHILIFVSHPLDNLAVRITFFLQQSYVFFVFNRFFLKFIYIINVFKK